MWKYIARFIYANDVKNLRNVSEFTDSFVFYDLIHGNNRTPKSVSKHLFATESILAGTLHILGY